MKLCIIKLSRAVSPTEVGILLRATVFNWLPLYIPIPSHASVERGMQTRGGSWSRWQVDLKFHTTHPDLMKLPK